jgi:hypothetical protein
MKGLLCSFLLLLSFKSFAQVEDKDTILIKAVDFSIKTFSNVRCSTFEKELTSKIILKSICDVDTVKTFRSQIHRVKTSSKNIEVDVRVKIYFRLQEGNPYSILCMDKFGNVILNGSSIRKNNKLVKLIRNCLPYDVL